MSMELEKPLNSYPGFKFSPTEEELVLYYLRGKIEGFQKCIDVISEIDITKHEPWDLPGFLCEIFYALILCSFNCFTLVFKINYNHIRVYEILLNQLAQRFTYLF